MEKITSLDDTPLCNKHKCRIKYDGQEYQSSWKAYNGIKDKYDKKVWPDVLYQILLCKFLQNPEFMQDLLDTASAEIEVKTDGMGEVLTKIREQIRIIR